MQAFQFCFHEGRTEVIICYHLVSQHLWVNTVSSEKEGCLQTLHAGGNPHEMLSAQEEYVSVNSYCSCNMTQGQLLCYMVLKGQFTQITNTPNSLTLFTQCELFHWNYFLPPKNSPYENC